MYSNKRSEIAGEGAISAELFYVTDIHGSNVCFRKFLNALPIYQVDVAVLNGDLLAKSSSLWWRKPVEA
jgi:Icc-related predicted phosphoesterase